MNTLKSQHRFAKWGSYLLLSLVAIIMVVPFLWMLSTSLKGSQEVYRVPPTLFPSELHWENFTHVLRDKLRKMIGKKAPEMANLKPPGSLDITERKVARRSRIRTAQRSV